MSWKEGGHTPIEIHARLVKGRKAEKPKRKGPDLTTVRRYIKGKTFKRSAVETRGRKSPHPEEFAEARRGPAGDDHQG